VALVAAQIIFDVVMLRRDKEKTSQIATLSTNIENLTSALTSSNKAAEAKETAAKEAAAKAEVANNEAAAKAKEAAAQQLVQAIANAKADSLKIVEDQRASDINYATTRGAAAAAATSLLTAGYFYGPSYETVASAAGSIASSVASVFGY